MRVRTRRAVGAWGRRVLICALMSGVQGVCAQTDQANRSHEAGSSAQQRAILLFRSGAAEAKEALYRALESAPDDVELLSHAGILAFRSGDIARAQTLFVRLLAVSNSVLELIPASDIWSHSVSNAHVRLAQTYEAQGQLERALEHYEASIDLINRAKRSFGYRPGVRDEVAATLASMGDLKETLGDDSGALESFRQSLNTAETDVAADPGDPTARRGVLVAHNRIAVFQLERSEPTEARVHLMVGMKLALELAKEVPSSEAKDDLALAHSLEARYQRQLGDREQAFASTQRSLDLYLDLHRRSPADLMVQRHLSVAYNHLASLQRDRGDLDGSLASSLEALRLAEALAAKDASHVQWQSDLAYTHVQVGDEWRARKDQAGALRHYEIALVLRRDLVRARPDDRRRAWDLLRVIDKTARMQYDAGNLRAATELHSESLRLLERFNASPHVDDDWRRAKLTTLWKLAELYEKQGARDLSHEAEESAHRVAEQRLQLSPGDPLVQSDAAASHNRLGDSRKESNDLEGALRSYRQSLALRRPLIATDTRMAREFALIAFKAAMIELPNAKAAERRELLEEGLQQLERLQALGELQGSQLAWPATFRKLLATLK